MSVFHTRVAPGPEVAWCSSPTPAPRRRPVVKGGWSVGSPGRRTASLTSLKEVTSEVLHVLVS